MILITSALPGEGKTFVSINLALSIAAELDRTVLLVDADVAKNDVARVLGVNYRDGPDRSPQREQRPHRGYDSADQRRIVVVSSVRSNVAERRRTVRKRQDDVKLMRELAEHDPNRIVIVDAPPLHAGTEASVLARMVGHVVVLVEADKTPQSIRGGRVASAEGL